jgi:hypothetical protein
MPPTAMKKACRISGITIEKIVKIITMEPADTTVSVIKQAALSQQKGCCAKAHNGLAALIGAFDKVNQRLLTWAVLRKQTADNCHIIALIQLTDGCCRFNHHTGTGCDRIARQCADFPGTPDLAAFITIIGCKAKWVEKQAEGRQRKTGQRNDAHGQTARWHIRYDFPNLILPISHLSSPPPHPTLYERDQEERNHLKCLESLSCCA